MGKETEFAAFERAFLDDASRLSVASEKVLGSEFIVSQPYQENIAAVSMQTASTPIQIHSPSLHMHLGKDILSIGKIQKKRLGLFEDSYLTFDYSSESFTEEYLSELFSSTSNQPLKRSKKELSMPDKEVT